MRQRKIFCKIVIIFSLLILSGPVQADILSINPITFQVQGTLGTQSDILIIDPFDPSLGTLDEVNVYIQGQLVINGIAREQGYYDSFGSFVPIPYQFTISVEQDIFGLAGGLFNFETPAKNIYSDTTTGFQESFFFSEQITVGFKFNDFTDNILGYAVPSTSGLNQPPTAINGSRDNFINDITFLDQLQILQNITYQAPALPMGFYSSFVGQIWVNYDYTPISQSVPDASIMLLLGPGLVGLAGFGRKRFKN